MFIMNCEMGPLISILSLRFQKSLFSGGIIFSGSTLKLANWYSALHWLEQVARLTQIPRNGKIVSSWEKAQRFAGKHIEEGGMNS